VVSGVGPGIGVLDGRPISQGFLVHWFEWVL